MRRHYAVRFHRGFSLIELILVLSVGSMITLLSFQGMKRQTEGHQAHAVGQQLRTVGLAVDTYIANRYNQISQLTGAAGTAADPGPRTCAGSACTITVQTLVNEGLLPATYQNLNSFGSGYTIALNVTGTSPNWNVTGLVTTSNPWVVGGIVRYDLLGQAMAEAGADSGMSRTSAAQIDGYGGVWSSPIVKGSVQKQGLLGFQVGSGAELYSVYLRRDGTLPMTGDLNMSDGIPHNINNVANITGTGRFTSSQTYTNYVNLAGNLDMSGIATIQGDADVSGSVNAGNVVTNNLMDYGNATVGGSVLITDNVIVGGTVSATGSVIAQNNVYAAGQLQAIQGAIINGGVYTNYVNVTGDIDANGTVSAGYLQPLSGATIGGACSPNGKIGTDGTQTLFCRSGMWAHGQGGVQVVAASGAPGPYTVDNGASVECPVNTQVISGGGMCNDSSSFNSLWLSAPTTNGWQVNCAGTGGVSTNSGVVVATAFAVCMTQ